MVRVAEAAAEILAREGIEASVFDAKFVKPLDAELVLSAAAGGVPVVAIEENAIHGGFGAALLEVYAERGIRNMVARLGIPDRFIPHGSRSELLEEIGLSPENVAETVRRMITSRVTASQGGDR